MKGRGGKGAYPVYGMENEEKIYFGLQTYNNVYILKSKDGKDYTGVIVDPDPTFPIDPDFPIIPDVPPDPYDPIISPFNPDLPQV